MKILKCEICGGAIERKGNFYVCLHCRNKWEIDAADDVHAVDRANAWAALRDGDYERATELFENILLKDKNSHEAHWGRALAANGILYVTDLSENKKVPTCNNITEDAFVKSKDVIKAISLAPSDIAETYKSQSEYIEKVRVEWLEKASKEPPYDVFISFKDSDRENGIERTQDSVDAQDLYNALTNEGYKVFFSRVSLRDKISEQYEPYIYNAIKTSKVMIVFGEKPEYFSSVWIKNEWSRFKTRIEKGEKHKNSLVVVYKNMNPGYLPSVLKSRQCLNASDMTFLSDLNRHIKRVVEETNKNVRLDRIKIEGGQIAKKATALAVNSVKTREIGAGAIAETSISEKQSVTLINTYLKAADWNGAEKLIEDVLFENPSCAEAIWCKILRNNKASDEQVFIKCLSSANAGFNDFELLEKLLNCSSKNFAAHILDLFYNIRFVSDSLQRNVLDRILPFAYSNRENKIREAFNNVIAAAHMNSFELLLTTLDSGEVDRYIAYNLAFVKTTKDIVAKRKVLNNVLAVDEGNLDALRLTVDVDIILDVSSERIKTDFETLLKYTEDADIEVVRIMDMLLNVNYRLKISGIEFAKQVLKYYSGNLTNLIDRLLKFAYRLLKNKILKEAEYYYNLIISIDKNCPGAYWGLCSVKLGVCNEKEILESPISIRNCSEFNKYLTLVDEKRRIECIELAKKQKEIIDERKQKRIKEIKRKLHSSNTAINECAGNIEQCEKELKNKVKQNALSILLGVIGIGAAVILTLYIVSLIKNEQISNIFIENTYEGRVVISSSFIYIVYAIVCMVCFASEFMIICLVGVGVPLLPFMPFICFFKGFVNIKKERTKTRVSIAIFESAADKEKKTVIELETELKKLQAQE